MNQWIFLVDSYGMKLEDDNKAKKLGQNQVRSKNGDNGDIVIIDKDEDLRRAGGGNGLFQPFIVKFMQDRKTSFYNHITVESPSVEDLIANKRQQIEPRKSSINFDP